VFLIIRKVGVFIESSLNFLFLLSFSLGLIKSLLFSVLFNQLLPFLLALGLSLGLLFELPRFPFFFLPAQFGKLLGRNVLFFFLFRRCFYLGSNIDDVHVL
jgi:hypothetical protein